jgi:D-alanine-D-alanine ligase
VSEGGRVALLFGGSSVEHEVSVVSARGVAAALESSLLTLVPLGVTGDGLWLGPERSRAILESDDARVEPCSPDDGRRVVLAPGGGGFLRVEPGGDARPLPVDVAFPLVHGWGGEDGKLQGALELAGVPYVGSDVVGSAVGMDKAIAKRVLADHGVAQAEWVELTRASYADDPGAAHRAVLERLALPVFVKPANGGSSVGISRVDREIGLPDAIRGALEHDRKLVIERGLDAREIECAVLGNDEPEASGLGEIVPSREFYDYEAKYIDGTSELKIPADLEPETANRIRREALRAFRVLDLRGMARVDFLLERSSGEFFLNEVNTLPGFTPISMFPKLWEAEGLPYPRLVERLVDLALDRWQDDRSRRTRRTG